MQPGHLQVSKKVKFNFSLRVPSITETIIQYCDSAPSFLPPVTSSLTPFSRTTMKSIAVLALAISALCLADERSSTETPISSTQRSISSSKKPELASKRLEQKQPEGRAIGRMEVSDAQLEMALKDKRYLQRQLKCTLGEAPCDPVGRRLRTLAPLVVRGSCPQCTPTEMRQIQKVLLHMQRNFPKEWARIVRTYQ